MKLCWERMAKIPGLVVVVAGLQPAMAAERVMSIENAVSQAMGAANTAQRHELLPSPLHVKQARIVKSPLWGTLWSVQFETEPARKVKESELLKLIKPWSFETRILSGSGAMNSLYVAEPIGGDAAGIPVGTPVPGKTGFCTSPNAYYASYVDVRYFDAGMIVRCPYSGLPFVIPELGR
jgi:hypothetical protein